MGVHDLEKLRPTGLLERYSCARDHLRFYNNVAVSAYYSGSPSPNIEAAIYNALAAVIRVHPILSAIPVNESNSDAYFARLPRVNMRECVEFVQRRKHNDNSDVDIELDELLSAQHNKPFASNNSLLPFWRLLIVLDPKDKAGFVATFVYHHALGDGLSGKVFHKDFQIALSSFEPSSMETTVSSTNDLLQPLEQLHSLPVRFSSLVKALWDDTFGSVSSRRWTGNPVTSPLVSRFISFTVSSKTARDFTATCRQEKTTLTATIETLVAASLFKVLPLKYSELLCQLAISFRRWISPPVTEDSMGVYVASMYETFQRQDFSWEEARRTRINIEDFLSQDGNNANVGLLRWVSNFSKHFQSKLGKPRTSSFEISNIGKFSYSAKDPVSQGYKIGRMVFSQSASVTGSAMEICIVSGPDDSLTIGCAWQDAVVDDELVERLMSELAEQIKKVSRFSQIST